MLFINFNRFILYLYDFPCFNWIIDLVRAIEGEERGDMVVWDTATTQQWRLRVSPYHLHCDLLCLFLHCSYNRNWMKLEIEFSKTLIGWSVCMRPKEWEHRTGRRNVFFNLTSRKKDTVDYARLLYTRYQSDHLWNVNLYNSYFKG